MKKITLVGAGGKMGCRLTDNLKNSEYQMRYLELSPLGIERLQQRGVSVSKEEEVVPDADIVILAVPDIHIGKVSAHIVPQVKSGAIVVTLDPAAALAGHLPKRGDVTYFISHPAHPSIFNWEPNEKDHKDFFGGYTAKQAIVCALLQGPESDYAIGEKLAITMYAPVNKSHRITAEQMGILEPALVETLSSTCLVIVREAMDEVIRRGVPEEAVKDFLLGHLNIQLAVLFDQIQGAVFSDAANKAIERARSILFKDDWKKIFEPENVLEQIKAITQ